MQIEALLNGGFQPNRYHPGATDDSSAHLPFAADLIAAMKPSLFVEVGARYADSYFGFCQAVRGNDTQCSCYAVNTSVQKSTPDSPNGIVPQDFLEHNASRYSDFSYFLAAPLNEALAKFSTESVDLLHVSGYRTYEAASRGFNSWLSKVKPGGIILLNNIMLRDEQSGVWKLWEEVASAGQHFAFSHGGGLGILRKGGAKVADNDFFQLLFDSPLETKDHVRKFYSLCAIRLEHEQEHPDRKSSNVSALPKAQPADAKLQDSLLADFRKLQSDLYVCKTDLKRKTSEEERLRAELAHTQHTLHAALTSQSWRITAPIRKISERLRGKR